MKKHDFPGLTRVSKAKARRLHAAGTPDAIPRSTSKTKGVKSMNFSENYISANTPTVVENIIKSAIWHGTPVRDTMRVCLDHAVKYHHAPREQFRCAILKTLYGALIGPEELEKFIERQLWRYPGVRTVRGYIRKELETELTLSEILQIVRGATA